MKKRMLFMLLLTCFCFSSHALAVQIRGDFSGVLDINGSLNELNNGDPFSGYVIYDTAATASTSFLSSGQTFAYVPGALVELSFDLTGAGGTYRYTTGGSAGVDVRYADTGDYALDFDFLDGRTNFVGGLDLRRTELILDFINTFVGDPSHPMVLPDAADLIPGSSFAGSVLYMSLLDEQGIFPGNAQLNGNITSLSLQQYGLPVPEPATAILLVIGLTSVAAPVLKRKIHRRS